MKVLTVTVQIADEGSDTALEVEGHFTLGAFIDETKRHAARDKRHFTEALHERIEAIINIFRKDDFIELKGLFGAGLVFIGFAHLLNFALWDTTFVLLTP